MTQGPKLITVPNEQVGDLMDPAKALDWINTNVKPYLPATKITGIAVRNDVFTGGDPVLTSNFVPAMSRIYEALMQSGLHTFIHVLTANSLPILENSYPQSAGAFRGNLTGIIRPLLQFLQATRSPFWINAYPYFAYKVDPSMVPLDYVLLNPNFEMVDLTPSYRLQEGFQKLKDLDFHVSTHIPSFNFKALRC